MKKPKKRNRVELTVQPNFEELEHRLACGWHVQIEDSGQRKRYLKSIKSKQFEA